LKKVQANAVFDTLKCLKEFDEHVFAGCREDIYKNYYYTLQLFMEKKKK